MTIYDEEIIISFGYIDFHINQKWDVHVLIVKDLDRFKAAYNIQHFYILDFKRLPKESLSLFDFKETRMNLSRGNFLLRLCKHYLEEYKID